MHTFSIHALSSLTNLQQRQLKSDRNGWRDVDGLGAGWEAAFLKVFFTWRGWTSILHSRCLCEWRTGTVSSHKPQTSSLNALLKNGNHSTASALNQLSVGAANTGALFSNLALVQLSTLIVSLPVRALGLVGEIDWGKGRLPIQTLFCWLFTSQESGEVNKQVLVFNCGPFIALPSSVLECSTPPFSCPSAHRLC